MNPETQDLIDRYVDGSASAEEVRRVDELVRQDPSVRHALLVTAAMRLDLQRLLTRTPDDARPAPRPASRQDTRGAWRTTGGRAAVLLAAAAGWVAAIVLAAAYHVQCREHTAALRTIAALESFQQDAARREEQSKQSAAGRVVQTRGLVQVLPEGRGKAVPVSVGFTVPAGRSLWTCPWGAAAMRFADGASVDLDRSTVAAISETNGVRQVALKRGVAFVTQLGAAGNHKIVVTTENGSVTVADAQVAVAVSKRGTIIEVAEGRARFVRKPDDPGIAVSAGQYAVVGAGAEPRALDGRLAWHVEPDK
jgi:ferric-dicitrate binding protein FerR (iron transport regulator)